MKSAFNSRAVDGAFNPNKRSKQDDTKNSNENSNFSKSLKDDATVDSLNTTIQTLQVQLAQSEAARHAEANSYQVRIVKDADQIKKLEQHLQNKSSDDSKTIAVIHEMKQQIAAIEAKNHKMVQQYEINIRDLQLQNRDLYWTLRNYVQAFTMQPMDVNIPPLMPVGDPSLMASSIPAPMYMPMMPMPVPMMVDPLYTVLPGNQGFFQLPPQNNNSAGNNVNKPSQSQQPSAESRQTTPQKTG